MNSKDNAGLFASLKQNQKYALTLMAFLTICLVACIILLVIGSIDFTKDDIEETPGNINDYAINNTQAYTVQENELLLGTLVIVNKAFNFIPIFVKIIGNSVAVG